MKCQKCGTSLSQDYLYCSKCGTEYQIVPDFDPEIENSIANAMSDVGDTIVTKEAPEFIPESADKGELSFSEEKGKRKFLSSLSFCIISVSFLCFFANYMYCNSVFYLEKQAKKSVQETNYPRAIEYYTKIRKKQPKEVLWYLEEAKLELQYGDRDSAIRLLYRGVEENGGNTEIYHMLFELLIENEEYREVYRLLQDCGYDEIKTDFREYDSQVKSLSHEGGTYYEILPLTVDTKEQTVFYTLDGSTPDPSSEKYSEPIFLGNGKHTVSFISYNKYGIPSKIVRNEYEIITSTPLSPKVTLQSGVFWRPQLIEVMVEPQTTVYYTTDGSLPTENSRKYEGPIPLPLGESQFIFVAISNNNVMGEPSERNYQLTLYEGMDIGRAEQLLMDHLIASGHILDGNGAIMNRYGVFRYFYQFPLELNGEIFHVFEEHYLENLINNALGNYYGVNINTGKVHLIKCDYAGNYSLDFY